MCSATAISTRRLVFVPLAIVLVLLTFAARPYVHGATFVIRAAGLDGAARRIADWDTVEVRESDTTLAWRGGVLRARDYLPRRISGRTILLVPGVHAAGIDEPRFVGFARQISASGHHVVTARLDDLARYQITARTTDMIEDAAGAVSSAAAARGEPAQIGLLGISFGGGLSIVAAGRPSLRGRLAFVMAFGGHADLPRTLTYLCTGVQADGVTRPPHDYGLAIVLLGVTDRVVPADQVRPLKTAILSYLEASRLDTVDKPRANAEFARAKDLAAHLDEPSKTYMNYVNARDVAKLGPILLPHLADVGGDPALSPARSPKPDVPVFLLHGTDDNVVPAIESTLLAVHLRAEGVPVHLLLTPLVTHAEVDKTSTASAMWALIHFWTDLLNA
jgi:dienelactone hydrolase